MVVTSGERGWGVIKRGKYKVMGDELTLGGGHATQCRAHISLSLQLKPI